MNDDFNPEKLREIADKVAKQRQDDYYKELDENVNIDPLKKRTRELLTEETYKGNKTLHKAIIKKNVSPAEIEQYFIWIKSKGLSTCRHNEYPNDLVMTITL